MAAARKRTPLIVLFALWMSCWAAPGRSDDEKQYLLERVDDAAVVQLYVNGFEKLSLKNKLLVYHLSQAATAGRDIFIDQKYKHSLSIRDLMEEVITHPRGIDPKTLAEVRRYAKLFWINNGPHNAIISQKNVLLCSPQAFRAAVLQANKNGAKFTVDSGASVEDLLDRLQGVLFDPQVDSHATQKTPPPGKDILQASANNFYQGVSLKDLADFKERNPLNSKLVKRPDGKLEEIVWRAGFDHLIPPGMYAKKIQQVIRHLEAAIPYATPKMARALGLLIHYYRTGDPLDFREYNIAWVADRDSPVDTINGFIEVYIDARGQKGAWEALVYFNDPENQEMIQKLSDHAQWFEDRMPYDPAYRKPNVKGISAKAIQVVMESGDSGPVTPIGINLPNGADIREKYGSKSVSLSNVMEAYDKAASRAAQSEFCFDEQEFARAKKWKSRALTLEVNMHEVIGHASGRVSSRLTQDPSKIIKEYYSALEEARADLVALWFIGDPKLIELGMVKNEQDLKEIQLAAYEAYSRNALEQLRRVKKGQTLEEDHMRNRQLIVLWLIDNTKAIRVVRRDGKIYYRVADVQAWRRGVGELLKEVQRIKSEGDRPAATLLLRKYGINIDTKIRDEVLARFEKHNPPSYTGFVMPQLTLQKADNGDIIDVKISYPQNLEQQMLKWSGRR